MSERKVLNKYFPPDFDPAKIPRRKIAKDAQQVVRLMAPFTMCCITCGEFIYKGKKFNAKKETALGETYYGIKIFRFYIKCTRCSAEITFKTDPKNADYFCEHGATRNYEPTTEKASHMPSAADDDSDAGESDPDDPMKMLEESQMASKRQMEDEDMLADLRQRNARIERNDYDPNSVLASAHASSSTASAAALAAQLAAEQEDEEEVKKWFYKVQAPPAAGNGSAAGATGENGTRQMNGKSKGKGKEQSGGVGLGGLGGDYGSDSDPSKSEVEDADAQDDVEDTEAPLPATVSVKRKFAQPWSAAPLTSSKPAEYQPSVAEILAAKGITFTATTAQNPIPATTSASLSKKASVSVNSLAATGTGSAGIKRKDLASKLGIKVVKKKKV